MALSPDVIFDIASACVCAALILARVVYRVLFRCKLHPTCHRTWRIDDFYMTIAILPLIGRASCISLSFVLNPTHTYEPATEAEAAAQGISVDRLNDDRMLSHKLLIPARICYALFLWCLKLGLLAFYTRFINVFPWGKVVAQTLWAFIVFTFVAVVITTLAECRPLSLMWALNFEDTDETCHRALGNLILMAVCNIISDVALIILPFPILQHLRLDLKAKLQLGFLFSVGGVVVAITILRLPLILNEDVSQESRSMVRSHHMIRYASNISNILAVGFGRNPLRVCGSKHAILLRPPQRPPTTTRRPNSRDSERSPTRGFLSTEFTVIFGSSQPVVELKGIDENVGAGVETTSLR
ncbi:hypothetical protein FALBO_9086 [Fusarium albosuccineum]|uniref:Rhodopsin domain-containing protein n=1 Tax=Fusarium albosuccineum TaxID=1237068 RepID=A0A8H4LAA2_9HYPO|nr:hypothetical protein FALBO_9086 [Fusarium albosuccineum]